ncbi:MAG: aldo/keto reductase [Candidatus Thiodiazotropha taylori]
MRYLTLPHSDLKVSAVCLGTMTFGTQNSEAEAHAQLDYAVERGINFIDTAEMYSVPPTPESYGKTESMVGNWLKGSRRDDVILASKIAGPGRSLNWIRDGDLSFDRTSLRAAVEETLRRLRTDYLDLYQLHWPARNVPTFGSYLFDPKLERDFIPFRETLEALAELVQEGKIRYVGLSTEWPWGVMKFLQLADEYDLPRVISVQNAYSLLNRTYETSMLEMGYREGVSLLAYSPLAFGLLSAKYLRDPKARGRVTLFDGFAQRYQKPAVEPAVAAYSEQAVTHGLSPAALALAFVYSRWFVASTIIGTTTMEQLRENIDAFEVEFSPELEVAIQELHLTYFNPAP